MRGAWIQRLVLNSVNKGENSQFSSVFSLFPFPCEVKTHRLVLLLLPSARP